MRFKVEGLKITKNEVFLTKKRYSSGVS